jgi:hypothetical protein
MKSEIEHSVLVKSNGGQWEIFFNQIKRDYVSPDHPSSIIYP